MRKLTVYIAGPMSKGDYIQNVRAGMNAWHELVIQGFVPFCPHLSAFLYLLFQTEHTYDFWLEYDFEWIKRCDAVLRLPGESFGADQEVAFARLLGLPVFSEMSDLIKWQHEQKESDSWHMHVSPWPGTKITT